MQGKFSWHLVTFVVGLALAVGTFVVSLQLAGALFAGETTTVRALLPTTSGLGKGSRVTMAGTPVGRVGKVSRQGYATLVELEITDESVLPVANDSRVTLRQRTPVGENYVEVTPGRSSRGLDADAVLPIRQSDEYVDVDQILSVLQGPSRKATRQLVRGLGGAVDDRGEQLNQTLGEASTIVQEGGELFGVLDEDRRNVASLIDRLGRVTAAVGERGAAVEVTADRGLAALKAVAGRDAALRETLEELPSTLAQVRGSTTNLKATSQVAAPVVGNLAAAVRDLRPAIRDLRPAAQQGRNVVRELGAATKPLQTTLGGVRGLSDPLTKALPQLQQTICELAPVVRYAEPYTRDIISAVAGLGSASNSYDAVGHLVRLSPIAGENSLAGAPDAVTQAAFTLTKTGLLGQSSPLTWNPYPKPGQVGKDGAKPGGGFSGPKALGASGYKYPRIQADC